MCAETSGRNFKENYLKISPHKTAKSKRLTSQRKKIAAITLIKSSHVRMPTVRQTEM